MNYCEDIEFKTWKENKEVIPQNLNSEQNSIELNKEQNKGNKKFIHKKVSLAPDAYGMRMFHTIKPHLASIDGSPNRT